MKYYLKLFCLIGLVFPVSLTVLRAQIPFQETPIIQWEQTIGGSGFESLSKILPYGRDSILLAGSSSTQSSVDGDKRAGCVYCNGRGEPGCTLDFWFTALNPRGQWVCDNVYGFPEPLNGANCQPGELLKNAIQLSDGGILAIGDFYDNYWEESSQWIIRLKPGAKDTLWSDILIPNIGSFQANVMLEIPSGGFLLGGGRGRELIRYDDSGNKIWEKSPGLGRSIQAMLNLPDGNILLLTDDVAGSYHLYKIDTEGNVLWDKIQSHGGGTQSLLSKMILLANGDLLLGGRIQTSAAKEDYWLVKTDAEGNKLWEKTYGGADSDQLTKMLLLSDGGFLLGGSSKSNASGQKSENSRGDFDYWILRIDAQGQVLWEKTYGGSLEDKLSDMVLTAEGNLIIGGNSNSNSSGEKSERAVNRGEFWVLKLNEGITPTSVKVYDAQEDVYLQDLKVNDTIHLNELGTDFLAFECVPTYTEVESFDIQLSGPVSLRATANEAPFTLFGYNTLNLFEGVNLPLGNYLLTVTPYSEDNLQGQAGMKVELPFTLAGALPPLVKQLVLVDAQSDQDIQVIRENEAINLGLLGDKEFNIRVELEDGQVGSVALNLQSNGLNHQQVENQSPYALFGDNSSGNYLGKNLPAGDYTLGITTFLGPNKSGVSRRTENFKFRVINLKSNTPGVEFLWDKTLGGLRKDHLVKIVPTSDGGFVLGGTSDSPISGEKSQASGTESEPSFCFGFGSVTDSWLIKVNEQGGKIWDKTFKGYCYDNLLDMESLPDGGLIFTAYWFDYTETPVSRLDAQGNLLWLKLWNLPNILPLPNQEGFLLWGSTIVENGEGEYYSDYSIIKIDMDGNQIWQKFYGGNRSESLQSVILIPEEGFLLGGSSLSNRSGDKSQNSKGEMDYWLVKTDLDGNLIWDKTFGGSGDDTPRSMIRLQDGTFVVGGDSRSGISGDKTQPSQGKADFWLLRIDAQGNLLWDKTIGTSDYDGLTAMLALPQDEILLGGYMASDEAYIESIIYLDDSFKSKIIKINKDGEVFWEEKINGNQGDYLNNLLRLDDGSILLGLTSFSNKIFQVKSEDSRGEFDYWIIKMKDNTSVDNIPSPVQNLVLVNTDTNQDIKTIQPNDVIDLDQIGTDQLSIRADISGGQIAQVFFELSGSLDYQKRENTAPFALFGDGPGNDYYGRKFCPGNYLIKVTPYDKQSGKALPAFELRFQLKGSVNPLELTLIDAGTDSDVGALGNTVVGLPNGLSIRADADDCAESVRFVLKNAQGQTLIYHIENLKPYSLLGELNGTDYLPWKPLPGDYTLEVTTYSENNASGLITSSLSAAFQVVEGQNVNLLNVSEQVIQLYPNPNNGDKVHIRVSKPWEGKALMQVLDKQGNIYLSREVDSQELDLDISSLRTGYYIIRWQTESGVFHVALVRN